MANDVNLPEGFVLDEPQASALPSGFQLDKKPKDYSPIREEYTGITAPIGRLAEDVRNRALAAQEIQDMYRAGQISKPEEIAYLAGKAGAGLVGDIGANVIETGLQGADYLTGGAVTKGKELLGAGVSNVGSVVGRLPTMGGGKLGEELPRELGRIAESAEDFSEENRRAAIAAESFANIALIAPALKYGEDIISKGGKLKQTVKNSQIRKMSSDELREKSSDLYALARQKGGDLKENFTDDLLTDFGKMQPKTQAGAIIEGQSRADQIISDLADSYSGKKLDFDTLMEMDEKLGQAAFSEVDNFGKMTNEGRKLYQMQGKLRSAVDNAADDMFVSGREGFEIAKEAKKYWAAQAQLRDIERVIENAQYMQQPSSSIKTGMRQIIRDKSRFNRYSPETQFAIKKAASTGALEGFYRAMGSDLLPIVAGGAGGGATMGAGGVGALAAIPARGVQKLSQRQAINVASRKAAQVEDAIRAGILTPQAGREKILKAYVELGIPMTQALAPIGAATYANETLTEKVRRLNAQKAENKQ